VLPEDWQQTLQKRALSSSGSFIDALLIHGIMGLQVSSCAAGPNSWQCPQMAPQPSRMR
jgi:hypothetical protein